VKKQALSRLLTKGIGHTRFKQTELGELPEGWDVRKLGDVLSLEYGKSLPARARVGGNVPVFGSNGIVGWHSTPLVRGCGIIVGRKGTVGAVHWSDKDFWAIDTTYFVKPKEDLELRWLYYVLVWLRLDRLNAATGVPGLNREDAYRERIPFPPLEEQRRIAELLSAIDKVIENEQRYLQGLEKLKKWMLNNLLTGKVRLPEWVDELLAEKLT
jgi:type I restriction enzyme S subunit